MPRGLSSPERPDLIGISRSEIGGGNFKLRHYRVSVSFTDFGSNGYGFYLK
jgi:hypothetical protein